MLHFPNLVHVLLVAGRCVCAEGGLAWGAGLVGLQQLDPEDGEGNGEKVAFGGALWSSVQAARRQFVQRCSLFPLTLHQKLLQWFAEPQLSLRKPLSIPQSAWQPPPPTPSLDAPPFLLMAHFYRAN